MIATAAVATSDDGYTYRVEGKPMKSNVMGGWVTVPGYSSVSKERAGAKKSALTRAAIANQTGMKYRVMQNRTDGGYRPKPGTDFWGNGQ
jgi:hypothetical protein